MKGQGVLFASARTEASRAGGSTDNWGTPQALFDLLNGEFKFTLDPCADASNAKCAYFDEADDGLAQDWGDNVCFVNFPYSQAWAWSEKCLDAASKGAVVVVLCAARTDTKWWQELVAHATAVRFIRGRLAFTSAGSKGQSATFPSCIVILGKSARTKGAILQLWDLPAEVRR